MDDSILYRELLASRLALNPEIEVVDTAGDAYEVRDRILELHPDVMTCDIEMPRLNGLSFIRQLLPQY